MTHLRMGENNRSVVHLNSLTWNCSTPIQHLCYTRKDINVAWKRVIRLSFLTVFDEYQKITELSIEDSIKNELSGDFERLMLAVGKKQ